MNRIDQAYGDFMAGIEPVVRDERDRWFRSLPIGMQRKILTRAVACGKDRQVIAAVLFVDVGLSQRFAESLVEGVVCETIPTYLL